MYEIIPDTLATHGIGDDYVVQPIEKRRTGEKIVFNNKDWIIIDARVLSDEGLSSQDDYEWLIAWCRWYESALGHRICICCGAGQSRSNAIALGYLVYKFNMDFYGAWELVKKKVPICYIMPDHISMLKKIFGVTLP